MFPALALVSHKMSHGKHFDAQIQACLARLGISAPVEWDVLAYVYRHQASLTNADQIARMLGYPSTVVADALDHMETLQLIRRSRASQGMRLYQFGSQSEPHSDTCFQLLIELAETPAGRSMLVKKLNHRRAGLSPLKKKHKND